MRSFSPRYQPFIIGPASDFTYRDNPMELDEFCILIAREGATHLHFDAPPLRSAATVANLVHLLRRYSLLLRALCESNPKCRRVGGWPDALFDLLRQDGFRRLSWPAAQEKLQELGLSKL